jgi:hypothetical protein
MALKVLIRVGRGSGASAIKAAIWDADGTPGCSAATGAVVVVVFVVVVVTPGTPVRSG